MRRRLTALPQDGVRLRGTARRNLDPFGRYAGADADADAPLEQALRKTGVWATVKRRGGLDADMAALGLSAGQAQLFFLARALLGGGAVVLLDEATSCVDARTDDAVRAAIRDDLRGRTVVEVAHRLDVLRACDVVVVMAAGEVVEVGEPEALLAKGASAFKALWDSRRL